MPGVLDRVREVRRQLVAGGPGGGNEPDLEHLQNLTNELRGPADGVVRLTQCTRILGIESDGGQKEPLVSRLQTLQQTFNMAPENVGQRTEFSEFKTSLVAYNTSLRETAKDRWDHRKAEVLQKVPEAMLLFWETIPDLQDDVAKLRQGLGELERTRDVLGDAERLKKLVSICEEIEQIAERLDSFDAPPAVRVFLRSARGSGAGWAQLTDEVRDWLNDHGLLDSLRIRLG